MSALELVTRTITNSCDTPVPFTHGPVNTSQLVVIMRFYPGTRAFPPGFDDANVLNGFLLWY